MMKSARSADVRLADDGILVSLCGVIRSKEEESVVSGKAKLQKVVMVGLLSVFGHSRQSTVVKAASLFQF